MTSKPFSTILVSLNYAPEPTGNAPYSTKLAEGLRSRGTEIQVLTGYPHYPEWTVREGYTGFSMREEINGVDVRRLLHAVPSTPRMLPRMHMELSYGLRSVLASWRKADVILAVSPALFATGLAVLKARIVRKPIGVWVQDLYSRGLEETKGSSSVSTRLAKHLEGLIFRSATEVSVIHDRFRDYVVDELGVPTERVQMIRNWSHITISKKSNREEIRERMGWKTSDFIALHAGNMGMKQNLENVIDAARLAENQGSSVRFVLLGHGNQRAKLEEYAQGAKNITFIDPLPDAEFTEALQCADALVVNEMPGVREMSVPSKLTSYFATGLPVVAATENDSATADEIRSSKAGLLVGAGQPASLLSAAEELHANKDLAARLGAAGAPYVLSELDEDRAINAYTAWLYSMANEQN